MDEQQLLISPGKERKTARGHFLKFQVRQQNKEEKTLRTKAADSVPASNTLLRLQLLISWFRSLGARGKSCL